MLKQCKVGDWEKVNFEKGWSYKERVCYQHGSQSSFNILRRIRLTHSLQINLEFTIFYIIHCHLSYTH